jgi:chromosomal replication initiation ATPase DnaA
MAAPHEFGDDELMPGARDTPRQLALSLAHGESYLPEDFLPGPSNADACAMIAAWPNWPARALVLIGPPGSGKSHLAAIWAGRAGARRISAAALHAGQLPADIATGALVVEDLAPGAFDEPALFHLLNLAREEKASVFITASSAPSGWTLNLKDLASRLRELPTVSLAAPDDALLRAVAVKLFADRQLAIDETVVAYLLTHIERSLAAVRDAVILLDHEALRQQRPISRALAADLFRPRTGDLFEEPPA